MTREDQRFAFLVPTLVGGGAERVTLNLAVELSRCSPVDLVLRSADGAFLKEVPEQIRIVDLGARRMLTSVPALARYLRRERPVAMLSALNYANVVAVWARALARTPTRLVLTEHNTLSSAVAGARTLRNRFMPWWIRASYGRAECIVAVSQGVADDLARTAGIPRRRIRVIYNPVVTPELRQKALAPIAHPWFEPGQPPVALAIGRLTAQKDFPTLLHAFQRVRQQRPARLLVLGEGPDREALETLVGTLGLGDDVALPGFVDNPYPYMREAAVFVNSARWEGLPTALIEALYCGTPIVATDCPSGPREILADGRHGRLVPMGDAAAIAAAITAVLEGAGPTPEPESWSPYELDAVAGQYREALEGGPAAQRPDGGLTEPSTPPL
jgi:glycosyltransferase involved in cell wall biosynthesis